MRETDNIFALTKQDSAVLKGIAIVAMLMHHLWGCPPEWVTPYAGVFGFLGGLGKVCVAIFLFCSGYGLSVGYSNLIGDSKFANNDWRNKIKATLKFQTKRFVKFYAGYWPIFLIFVPIGVFVFERPLSVAYGEHVNIIKRLIYDFIGVQGFNSYNITWWFNQLIIILYLVFPMLYRLIRIKPWAAIIFGLILMRFSSHVPFNPADICTWQFPFVLGIIWHLYEDRGVKVQKWIDGHKYMTIFMSLLLLGCLIILRMFPIIPHWGGIRIDGFLSCVFALCIVIVLRYFTHLMKILAFLGKHSMNIYMTHTFFFSYWFSTFFYSSELGGGYEYRSPSHDLSLG